MRVFLILLYFMCQQAIHAQSTKHCKDVHSNQKVGSESALSALDPRSDSIDLIKHTINLNITDFTNQKIAGNTAVKFKAKVAGVHQINLDLLQLTIDSVVYQNQSVSFLYNDTLVQISLPNVLNVVDTEIITLFYHGTPQKDATWGGFFFENGFAYNMGVAFSSNPHPYGRIWFPCFDNFVERSLYEFNITTNNGKLAYCNGLLTKDTTDINGLRTRTWVLNESIPSYLVMVAVGNYTQVNSIFNGLNGTIPIELVAAANDTNNLKASFIHLPNALTVFEHWFGPYVWEKVGYSVVPFTSGAMEHATNISYPRPFVDGSLTDEAELMSHELAHHWWGNLATCRTPEDMWLNEGWASYSGFLFTEGVYGYADYITAVRNNHDYILHYANVNDGGYLTLNNIPHASTYGDHVYLKGADLAHTLRSYMGDSLFRMGLQYHLQQSMFKDVSSEDFRDHLVSATNLTQVHDFFEDWIFQPGFPHFSIDSSHIQPSGNTYDVAIFIKQKLRGATHFYTQVPIEITFFDSLWNSQTETVFVSGENTNHLINIPFYPVFICLDLKDKISDAITSDTKTIKTNGASFSQSAHGRMRLTTSNVTDSSLVRIEHHWVKPDPIKDLSKKYRLTERYWSVDGIFNTDFYTKAVVTYDGRTITSGGNGWMDNEILNNTNLEDSLVLLYRANPSKDWNVYPYYTKQVGTLTDKFGIFQIDSLKKGEYTIGLMDHTVQVSPTFSSTSRLEIYPNPGNGKMRMNNYSDKSIKNLNLHVYNAQGKLVYSEKVPSMDATKELDLSRLSKGIYFLNLLNKDFTSTHKIIIE